MIPQTLIPTKEVNTPELSGNQSEIQSSIHTTRIMKTESRNRGLALLAGLGYLIIFFTGIYANFYVLESLKAPTTELNLFSDAGGVANQLRSGLFAFVCMVIFDLVLTWALFELLKPVSESLSRFAAWFRLVNCAVFAVALYHLFSAVNLTADTEYLALFGEKQAKALFMQKLSDFDSLWLIGLVFFGIHLIALGVLVLKSASVPRLLGILLVLAGLGYLTDSFAQFLLPDYGNYQDLFMMAVVLPGVVGEMSFTIWLLIKGSKKKAFILN